MSKKNEKAKEKATKLTFKVIRNVRSSGRTPSEDRFTLSKDGHLLFNSITRKKFNILSGYARFLKANEPGEERNIYFTIHKSKLTPDCMKISRVADGYFKVRVPSSATKEVGLIFKAAGGRGKRKRSITHYRAERYGNTTKNRKVKLIPVSTED